MKKGILGITALLAVVAILSFTACDSIFQEKDDGIERVIVFNNFSNAKIGITCVGTPSYIELDRPSIQGSSTTNQVKRTGFPIEIKSLAIIDPPNLPDPWDLIELTGSLAPANGKGKNGLKLDGGILNFNAARGVEGGNLIGWKITVIPQED